MSSSCTPTYQPGMADSEGKSFPLNSRRFLVDDANPTNGTCHVVVAPEDTELSSPENVQSQKRSSTPAGVVTSQAFSSQTNTSNHTAFPSDTRQREVIELLSKGKDEVAAAKSSQPDPVPPVSSRERFVSVPLPEEINQEEARRLFGVLSQIDSVKTTGGKTYNYEEKYPEDAPGDELGANARVFKVYNDEAERYDADMIRGFRDSLDGLLVFASLFSAVVTTILMQTIQVLPTDQSRITNHLLYETTLLLRANGNATVINSISQSPYGPTSNTFSTDDVWINALFIASLALSLTTALLSVLAKQWLQAYMSLTSGSARDVALIRHLRFIGLERWKLSEFIGTLPLILHTSLGLFFAGLFLFVRTLYPTLGWIVASISGVTVLVYLGTIILPTFYLECPFRLPVFYRTLEKAEQSAVAESSRSHHANPIESITWLLKLSSNVTVKHVAVWIIASENAWKYSGLWDFLSPDTVQLLLDSAWTMDWRNTVAFRALKQLRTNAFGGNTSWTTNLSAHVHAIAVRNRWTSILKRELRHAIEAERVDYVREMVLAWGTSADTMLGEESAFELAVRCGNMKIIKFLVTEGKADVDLLLTGGHYCSALAAAARYGRLEVAKFLVTEGGADVNLLLPAGRYGSALAAAAYWGQLDVVRFLVSEGSADVNLLLIAGDFGSALAAAAYWGELEVVKFLVTEGKADINLLLTAGHYGSALAAAAYCGRLETVKFLVTKGGADVNLLLVAGRYGSALAAATYANQLEVVKFLVVEGANVNLPLPGRFASAMHAATAGQRGQYSHSTNARIIQFLQAIRSQQEN
ncbi:hypothetical protein DL96DRAFT_1822167, partial [Flagelloscypha sp. PMI_526]